MIFVAIFLMRSSKIWGNDLLKIFSMKLSQIYVVHETIPNIMLQFTNSVISVCGSYLLMFYFLMNVDYG